MCVCLLLRNKNNNAGEADVGIEKWGSPIAQKRSFLLSLILPRKRHANWGATGRPRLTLTCELIFPVVIQQQTPFSTLIIVYAISYHQTDRKGTFGPHKTVTIHHSGGIQ